MKLLIVPVSIVALGLAVAVVVKTVGRYSQTLETDQCSSNYHPTIDDAVLLGCDDEVDTRCCVYRGKDHEDDPCQIVMCQMECGPWKYASVVCYSNDEPASEDTSEKL